MALSSRCWWSADDQLVSKRLFSHKLLFFLDGWLDKVMNKNSIGDHCPD
jgi:hypothetical protein